MFTKNSAKSAPLNKAVAWLTWLGCGFLIFFRFRWINDTVYEWHAWRQSETVMMIESYYRYGINLLKPQIAWLGPYRTYAFEFPLPQAIIAFLYRFTGNHIIVAKIFFFLFFLIGCIYLYQTLKRYADETWARWAVLCYLVLPLSFYYSIALQVDFLEVTAALACLYHALRFKEKSEKLSWGHLIAFGIWFLLGSLEKPPYLLCTGLAVAYAFVNDRLWKQMGYLVIAALPGLIAAVWWIKYSAFLNSHIPFLGFLPGFTLHPDTFGWYFGNLEQRENPETYVAIFGRSFNNFTFPVCVAFLAGVVMAILNRTTAITMWLWSLFGSLLMVFIIINLNVVHDYYQVPLCLSVAVFASYALSKVASLKPWLGAFLGIIVVYGGIHGAIRSEYFFKRAYPMEDIAQIVDEHTKPEEILFIANYNTGSNDPIMLGFARRYGFVLPAQLLQPYHIDSVKSRQATKVVLVNHYEALDPAILSKIELIKSDVGSSGTKVDVYSIR